MNEYPLYPELNDTAKEEAVQLIESFKKQLSIAAEKTISSLYTEMLPHIESDSWANVRRELMDGLKNYSNAKAHLSFDFKAIRAQMLKEYRDEIIADLNQDLIEENENLKKQIKHLISIRHNY
jgi:hypothetical protein